MLDTSSAAPETTPLDQIEGIVAAAREAQPSWAARPLKGRIAALSRAAKRMLDEREEVIALMERETGKVPVESLMSEVLGPLDQVKQWGKLFKRHTGAKKVGVNPMSFPGKKVWVELVPRGVIAAITPWNYPFGTFFRPVLPALLAGNGLVVKPSEHSSGVARWFLERLQAELPAGLLGIVYGDRTQGAAVIDAGVDAATFTGSVAGGRAVARQCATHMIPLSAELGGNDAAIVLADCSVDFTLAGVTHWALHNAGQNCGAIERLYVEEAIADSFTARLADAWSRLTAAAAGDDDDARLCPLSTSEQLAIVESHVQDAVDKGATLRCGGRRTGEGLGYEPTLLDNCTPDMRICQEESFGPVLAVTRVPDAQAAIRLANDSRYGLGGSVWTADVERGRQLAEQLEVGVLNVNNHAVTGAMVNVPWTGVKDTGSGVANSPFALTTFMRPRTLLVDKGRKPDLFWMPFDNRLRKLGGTIAELQLGRIGGILRLPGMVRKRIRTVREFFSASTGAGS